jgi:hypothetical protein
VILLVGSKKGSGFISHEVRTKMIHTSHLLTIQADGQVVVDQIADVLGKAGLQVVQSFDLQVAKAAHSHCSCPHHGSEKCDCQMIMLLVYERDGKPATLVAHGQDGKTHLGMITDANRGHSSYLMETILNIFSKNSLFQQQSLWLDAT